MEEMKEYEKVNQKEKRASDMCTRPLLGKIILFSLPLIATGILQLLYNAADIIVVGRFADHTAMAAVGSTSSLVNLIINLFIGLSVGTLSVMSRQIGAGNREKADKIVHTSIPLSLIGGVIVGIIGFFGARFFLELMKTDLKVIDQAVIYLQIYFIGMPFCMLYNFGASILRACGDTKSPLIVLCVSGLINVGINFWLVAGYNLGVVGVAVGTTVSQIISSIAILFLLAKRKDYGKFSFRKMKIHGATLAEIIRIGLPAGIQGMTFSLSNVIIQSSINSFGDIAMAGNAAASSIEGFIYTSMNAISQACLTFTAQNYGAHKLSNLKLVLIQCTLIVCSIGIALAGIVFLFKEPLLTLYNKEPEVIRYGAERLVYICLPYLLCGVMEVLVGSLRGMRCSFLPMIFSIVSICGGRILWIYTVFKFKHTLPMLYLSYPISWLVAILLHFFTYIFVSRKVKKELLPETTQSQQQ